MITDSRTIQPPRSGIGGSVLILLTAMLFSIVPFLPTISPWSVSLSLVLLVIAVFSRTTQATHITFFTACFIVMPFMFPALRGWPFNLLIPFSIYKAMTQMFSSLRQSTYWIRVGRFTGDIIVMMIATALISGIALYAWNRLLKPDLSIHLNHLQDIPHWLYPLAGVGFSIGNAALEEFIFRGVIMQVLDSAFGPAIMSVVLQAWLFGSVHYRQGFPNGAWGIAMTFVYGIMLGAIRRRSQGMLAPVITHLFADAVIFAILASVAMKQ